jgi:atlastin
MYSSVSIKLENVFSLLLISYFDPGFEWKNTITPVTKGIWMWSKPFIFKNSVDEEIAILLMDSQGVFDDVTDSRDWKTIIGITLLISSIFIFNLFTDIQENNLSDLETFLAYGKMAKKNDLNEEYPFQKLVKILFFSN